MTAVRPSPPPPWAAPTVAVDQRRWTQDQREALVLLVLAVGGAAVIGMWWANNPGRSLHSFADRLTAAGRITGLAGTYLVLVQVVLMARLPWLDRWIGTDRMAAWHRTNGQYTIGLLVAHTGLITWGYAAADHSPIAREAGRLLRHYPDVLAATAALAVLVGVAVTSVRAAQRRLRYETWYSIHLYTYIAIALSFSHEFATGNEFTTHWTNRALWAGLYAAAFGALLVWRVVIPIRDALRYRLRIESVAVEGPDAVSVYVSGRRLDRMRAEAGQFFRWRFLDRQSWWEAHPFSLSAAPNGKQLRITAKGVGDHSRALRHARPGTRVMAEGPYGNLTPRRRTRARVLLIAGGVGITPLRAIVEALLAKPGEITLLYRASNEADLLFRSELERLANQRGIDVRYLLGRRGKRSQPLNPEAIARHVPDVAERDVFLCGPPGMMDIALKSLRTLGVPRSQIHRERFEL